MFVTPYSLVKPHIHKLKHHLEHNYFVMPFDESKKSSTIINKINKLPIKFFFSRYNGGDHLYVLTQISVDNYDTLDLDFTEDKDEHTKILDFFNKFPTMPKYFMLTYTEHTDSASLQHIRSNYSNQCYADALMYTLFAVPTMSRLEHILTDLNGTLIKSNKRELTNHILRFMLGVNNFIDPQFAKESFNLFLQNLYTFAKGEYTKKAANDAEKLSFDYIVGIDLDSYSILTPSQERVKNPNKPYAIKYMGPWTISFELEESQEYSIQSVLVYSPGHFTSILKTQNLGWVKYNDLAKNIEPIHDINTYQKLRTHFNDDIDICQEIHITLKLYNDLLDSHEEYWRSENNNAIAEEIQNRNVIASINYDIIKNNNHNDIKVLIEVQKVYLLEKYRTTNFEKVKEIFQLKIAKVKSLCPTQDKLIDQIVTDIQDKPVNILINELNELPIPITINFYPARFAIYDKI